MELRYNLGLLTFHRVTVRRAVDVTSERKAFWFKSRKEFLLTCTCTCVALQCRHRMFWLSTEFSLMF